MCKWTTKLVQKRQYPTLSQVLMIVGNNKDIKNILQPTPGEQAKDHIQNFAPYDVTNNITDTTTKFWIEILEKGGKILFDDIFRIDVESRRAVIPVTKLSANIDDGRRPERESFQYGTSRPPQSSEPVISSNSINTNDPVVKMFGELMAKVDMLVENNVALKSELSAVKS